MNEQAITIVYTPNIGIKIDGVELKWGTERSVVRQKLGNTQKTDDKVIDLSKYFNGDESRNIYQRRDIYKQFKDFDNYFFLKYNRQDKLTELEVHRGCEIEIMGIELSFSGNIKIALASLQSLSNTFKQLNPGDYYFKDLKLTIADSLHTGGEGHDLSYFYCSADTSHLDK
jgi:hypothetical protein